MHYCSFKAIGGNMRYIDFEEKVKEMGYGCEMVYDDYLGIPIKLQVRFGQGWVSATQKGRFEYTGIVSNTKEAHLVLLMSQLADTDLDKRVDEKEFVFPLPRTKTTYGCKQYLSYKSGTFFISRKLPKCEQVKQSWKQSELEIIPLFYLGLRTEKPKEW